MSGGDPPSGKQKHVDDFRDNPSLSYDLFNCSDTKPEANFSAIAPWLTHNETIRNTHLNSSKQNRSRLNTSTKHPWKLR